MYKRDIYLDIDDNLNNYIKSVELDSNSRVWHFHLTVDYEPLDLTGKSVQFRAEKPDKTNVLNDCKIVDAEKGVVEVKLTRQVNAIPGHVKCLLKIIGDEGFVLKTKTFVVDVSKTLSDDTVVSSDEFGALEAALGKVQDIDNRFAQTNAQLSSIYMSIDNFERKVGEIDDGARIQRCFDYCFENNYIAYSPKKDYFFSNTLTLKCSANLRNGTFNYSGNDDVALIVGEETKLENLEINLPTVIQSGTKYSSIGILCKHIYESYIYFEKIMGFDVGVKIFANNTGNVYNSYFLKSIINCKTLLLLESANTGWVNQNTFFGGRLYNSYEMLEKFNEEEIYYIKCKGDYHPINNNLFLNCCVETLKGYNIHLDTSSNNTFVSCRFEGDSKKVKYIDSIDNVIINGYDATRLNIDDDRSKNTLITSERIKMSTAQDDGAIELKHSVSSTKALITTYDVSGVKANEIGSDRGFGSYRGGSSYQTCRVSGLGLSLGDGTKEPTRTIYPSGENVKIANYNLEVVEKYFILAGYYIWFDENGVMRRKKGKPTTDTDGIVIGTQS